MSRATSSSRPAGRRESSSLSTRRIPIGTVESVGQQDVDLYKRIQVTPFVDFDSLSKVVVLAELPRASARRAHGGEPRQNEPAVTGIDALKAGGLILFATLVQVSIAEWIEVEEGHERRLRHARRRLAPRGLSSAPRRVAAGLVLDTAPFGTWTARSTIAGYWTGRFGEVTTRTSVHPLLIAVALATTGVTLGRRCSTSCSA